MARSLLHNEQVQTLKCSHCSGHAPHGMSLLVPRSHCQGPRVCSATSLAPFLLPTSVPRLCTPASEFVPVLPCHWQPSLTVSPIPALCVPGPLHGLDLTSFVAYQVTRREIWDADHPPSLSFFVWKPGVLSPPSCLVDCGLSALAFLHERCGACAYMGAGDAAQKCCLYTVAVLSWCCFQKSSLTVPIQGIDHFHL